MMYSHSGRSLASIITATAMVVALCLALASPAKAADEAQQDQAAQSQTAAAPPSTGPTKSFTEEDVNAAVKKTVDERSKDGAFVFHDPKLDADLNLVFEQVKGIQIGRAHV